MQHLYYSTRSFLLFEWIPQVALRMHQSQLLKTAIWVLTDLAFSDNPQLQKEFMQFIHTCVSHDNPAQYRILRQKLLLVRGMVQVI